MKKIKIKFCKYNPEDKCSYSYYILQILKKYYEVEISDNPDYLFYNESDYEHLNYSCVKIFYTGENIHPNFNFCDYAFGFDYLNFGDRYCRLPVYFVSTFYREEEIKMIENQTKSEKIFTKEDLEHKESFCSFVYSNYLADENRKVFFEKLNQYKKVNSGGRYLNNIGEIVRNKLAFEMNHKFSIAFENSSNIGYTTEKILNSISAQTIPIYWGNPEIAKEFNENRFINCHKYKNFDQVIERIKEIDNNDELYLEIINEPLRNFNDETENIFIDFLRNIFDQPTKESRRVKINPAIFTELRKSELFIATHLKKISLIRKVFSNLYKPFKSITVLEKFKESYFASKIKK
jgi:hypothetical protein